MCEDDFRCCGGVCEDDLRCDGGGVCEEEEIRREGGGVCEDDLRCDGGGVCEGVELRFTGGESGLCCLGGVDVEDGVSVLARDGAALSTNCFSFLAGGTICNEGQPLSYTHLLIALQWNLSKADTIGTKNCPL